MNFYEKWLLPRLVDVAMRNKEATRYRAQIVPQARGSVLEVGVGSGLNLPFYDTSKVSRIIGIDPSEELNTMAKKMAVDRGLEVEFILAGAESIPLPDNHVDTALITYTLCTIPDALTASKEILRVLKPGGKLIFCEHGLAADSNVAKWQGRIDPYWGKIAGGCHLNRDIPEMIRAAGFEIQSMEQIVTMLTDEE